jgi:hypothetical protein
MTKLPDEAELLAAEMAAGRWAIQSGPPAPAGNEPLSWNTSKSGRKRRMRKMLDLNLACRAGAVGTARRLGRDLH